MTEIENAKVGVGLERPKEPRGGGGDVNKAWIGESHVLNWTRRGTLGRAAPHGKLGLRRDLELGQHAWVAQSVKHPTLDFGSGHGLTVCEFEPCIGLCADSAQPAWDSLCPSLLSK